MKKSAIKNWLKNVEERNAAPMCGGLISAWSMIILVHTKGSDVKWITRPPEPSERPMIHDGTAENASNKTSQCIHEKTIAGRRGPAIWDRRFSSNSLMSHAGNLLITQPGDPEYDRVRNKFQFGERSNQSLNIADDDPPMLISTYRPRLGIHSAWKTLDSQACAQLGIRIDEAFASMGEISASEFTSQSESSSEEYDKFFDGILHGYHVFIATPQ